MALSMDEQRVLAEIERRLSAEDPGLAACLTSFRRPGPAQLLKSPRARILGSLGTVALVAVISLMVYALIPFRAHVARTPTVRTGQGQTSMTAASGSPVTTFTTAPSHATIINPAKNAKTGKAAMGGTATGKNVKSPSTQRLRLAP